MSIQLTSDQLNELFPSQMIENSDPLEIARERTNHFRYGLSAEDHEEFYGDFYNSSDYREEILDDFNHPLHTNKSVISEEIQNYEEDFVNSLQRQAQIEE